MLLPDVNVVNIRHKFDDGQQIFRRKSVEILLARISDLERRLTMPATDGLNGCGCIPELGLKGLCWFHQRYGISRR